jgi:DNA-binding NarL/FixJ family response regulator
MPPEIYREPLTEREKDVARLVTSGFDDDRIAHELGISVETVENDTATIFTKLDAAKRLLEAIEDAVRAAWDAGWGKADINRAVRRGRRGK